MIIALLTFSHTRSTDCTISLCGGISGRRNVSSCAILYLLSPAIFGTTKREKIRCLNALWTLEGGPVKHAIKLGYASTFGVVTLRLCVPAMSISLTCHGFASTSRSDRCAWSFMYREGRGAIQECRVGCPSSLSKQVGIGHLESFQCGGAEGIRSWRQPALILEAILVF